MHLHLDELVAAPEEARWMWQAQAKGYEDDDES